jgi:fimbrial chaperone protein
MSSLVKRLILASVGLSWSTCGSAADLRVAPATVEAHIGARTATLNVVNGEQRPLKVQVRVTRWTQQGNRDELSPTQDVVASPPFVSLKPGERYVVRLVRTAKSPVRGEESYRILVDEVPEPHTVAPGTVNFVLRQSIPVFFSDDPRRAPQVSWRVGREGANLWLVGRNTGTRRIRISDATIDARGTAIYHEAGLVGYVLPNSEMRWPIGPAAATSAQAFHMKATADTGALDVSVEAAPSK